MRWRLLFVGLVRVVEDFILEKCALYRIDYSHDLNHSRQVAALGFHIAKNDYHLSAAQNEILFLSCMLHDMCDAKYAVPWEQSVLDISRFLKTKCGVPIATHDGVMDIITSMSYSKVVRPDGTIRFPPWIVRDDRLCSVYHATREADLLSSYDIKRMVHYKHEKLGLLYSCDIYDDILDTVRHRMSGLLEKGLFVSPTARRMAKDLHQELCHELIPSLTEDDIYPILHGTNKAFTAKGLASVG